MARTVLVAVLIVFIGCRLPPILHQSGSTDEEWYAIPGLTIAREGIPRVPYSRATEPTSVFLGADRLLFGMPPLSFYAQAPFFLIFPPTYATARLASLLAGCAAIWLVFAIARTLWDDRGAGLWAAGTYSLCRLLYFPAMIARPDMLCGTLGLAAVWAMSCWSRDRRPRGLVWAGVCLGLGGLTHPFALVFALQIGAWAAMAAGTWRSRVLRPVGLAATALLTFAVWGALIIRAPELFRAQFVTNILKPTGPGLATRLLWPWPDFAEHLPLVIERAGIIQVGFLAACLLVTTGWAVRRRDRTLGLVAILGWSAIYLLIALQGQHPLQGYWCYPAAFFALAAGWCVARGIEAVRDRWGGRLTAALAIGLILAVFFPGSGLRATWACLRHRGEVAYNPREFTRSILATLPPDARLTVGAEYALDAYGLADRRVLLGIRHPDYFDSTRYAYDYAILGRTELDQGLDRAMGGRVLQTFGAKADPFSCFAVLLVPAGNASQLTP